MTTRFMTSIVSQLNTFPVLQNISSELENLSGQRKIQVNFIISKEKVSKLKSGKSFTFEDITLDGPLASIIEKTARETFYNTLGDDNGYQIDLTKLEFHHQQAHKETSNSICFKIKILRNKAPPFPEYFHSGRSKESIEHCKSICQQIEKTIKETCFMKTKVYFNGWEIGSIIIKGFVWSDDNISQVYVPIIINIIQTETQKFFDNCHVKVTKEKEKTYNMDAVNSSLVILATNNSFARVKTVLPVLEISFLDQLQKQEIPGT